MLKKFNAVQTKINNYYSESLQDYNISYMQWVLLKEIYLTEEFNLTAKKLENITMQNKRLISINLNNLEEQGFIERNIIENDKRNKEITIQEHMLDTCEILLALDNELEDILINLLSLEQQNSLNQLLDIVIDE